MWDNSCSADCAAGSTLTYNYCKQSLWHFGWLVRTAVCGILAGWCIQLYVTVCMRVNCTCALKCFTAQRLQRRYQTSAVHAEILSIHSIFMADAKLHVQCECEDPYLAYTDFNMNHEVQCKYTSTKHNLVPGNAASQQ